MNKKVLAWLSVFFVSLFIPISYAALQNVKMLALRGVVQSGGTIATTALANATVTLYAADETSAIEINHATTDSHGRFTIRYTQPFLHRAHLFYYLMASKDKQIKLTAILGDHLASFVTINELTTVAAAFSAAQFFHDEQIYGAPLGLHVVAGMNDNLVAVTQGDYSSVIARSPNGYETNTYRALGSLANLLASCVQDQAACSALFAASAAENIVPTNTLQAILNIAHYPANNVSTLFALSNILKIYEPFLTSKQEPNAWTLAVKFNESGSRNCMFGGPAKTVFDANGYAWITNNVVQGTPNSSPCIIVLKPNGQPADGRDHTPVSPIMGGGLLGTAFGITLDRLGAIWVGDFGWGNCADCLPIEGRVTKLSRWGQPLASEGYATHVLRAQGTIADKDNNIWIASFDNDRVVVYPKGNSEKAIYFQQPQNSGPFDIAISPDGSAWVTNAKSSSVSIFTLRGQHIIHQRDVVIGNTLKAIAFDSQGNAWVASTRDSSIYELSAQGDVLRRIRGVGGLFGPWGVTVDSDDNVWVANFGGDDLPMQYSITKLCGSQPAHCPAGLSTGDAISPASGYTLPTGGSQVLLPNGVPLNGIGAPPSFNPLMRLTHAIADSAGNVWAANNWKPLPYSADYFNPGGDGMVVFVGLAKPAREPL